MQQVFKGWSHEFLKKIQCSKSYNVCHHLQDFNSENVEAFKKCLYLRKKNWQCIISVSFYQDDFTPLCKSSPCYTVYGLQG